jgi:hypothetical protein
MRCHLPNLKICCSIWMLGAILTSCSKNDQNNVSTSTDIRQFSLVPGQDNTRIDESQHLISVRVPNGIDSGVQLTASFSLSPGASLTLNGIPQISGTTENDFEYDLIYTVTSADQSKLQNWKVQATNNDFSIPWELGHFIKSSVSLDRSYDWYIDQSTSGQYASLNCGPASVTMAIKWADESFTKTAQDARQTYESNGGWWYTQDIDSYLSDNQIDHAIIALNDTAAIARDIIIHQLDKNQIVILCLDMNYVRSASDLKGRIDKFYPTTPNWGHFIVLKGYFKVDSRIYFEAYDPYSFGLKNSDNSLKGTNRSYRYEDLSAATQIWWNYAFVIAKKGVSLSTDALARKLNPAEVPIARGGPTVF